MSKPLKKRKPRTSKARGSKSKAENERVFDNDIEYELIKKIDRIQTIVDGLRSSVIWPMIQEDYKKTSEGLDMAWAYEDVYSPRFKQMQASKMAATTFINVLGTYEHDLKLAKRQLEQLRNPQKEVKRDYDDEGISGVHTATTGETLNSNAYHSKE